MRNLNNIELEFVSKCPNILNEVVVRPISKKIKTMDEKLNDEFAEVAPEINSYAVKHDEVIRDIHKTAYEWSKTENQEIITEVITSYAPIRMSKNDVISIVKNAAKI